MTQYSALLFTPDCYTADAEKGEITLNDSLFSKISSPETKDRLDLFKEQLKTKLQIDLSVRKERRNSISGIARPRAYSATKRGASESISGSITKSARVPSLPSSSEQTL